MVGMPYDDLDGWRSIFPAETYIARCRQVAEGFDAGARQWQEVVAVCEGESKALAERDSRIGYECSCHYFYTPQDLREKVLNCRMILSVAADAADTTTCR